MQGSYSKSRAPKPAYWPGLSLARLFIMIAVAIGYISTMPVGPEYPEWGRMFGYDPSWIGMNVLFLVSGYLAIRSLYMHGSPWAMLKSRILRIVPSLLLFSILVVAVIFPIYGTPADSLGETLHRLADYMFGVVTCTDPGAVLPGVLDNAKYPCVIQGAIWTLKWGAIAYLALALGWILRIFQNRWLTLFAAIVLTSLYFASYVLVLSGTLEIPDNLTTALRLGTSFMIGVAAFGYRGAIKARSPIYYALAASALLAALYVQWVFLTWTPFIELTLTLVWICAFVVTIKLMNQITPRSWVVPELALGVFLFHWPIAQLLLLSFPEMRSGELILATLPLTLIAALALDRLNRMLRHRLTNSGMEVRHV